MRRLALTARILPEFMLRRALVGISTESNRNTLALFGGLSFEKHPCVHSQRTLLLEIGWDGQGLLTDSLDKKDDADSAFNRTMTMATFVWFLKPTPVAVDVKPKGDFNPRNAEPTCAGSWRVASGQTVQNG